MGMNGCQSKDQQGLLFRCFGVVNTGPSRSGRCRPSHLDRNVAASLCYEGVLTLKPASDSINIETFLIIG